MMPNAARLEGLLRAMSPDEKLGQLTMIRADFGDAGAELGAAKIAEIQAGRTGSILDLRGLEHIQKSQRAAVEGSRLGIPLLFTLDVLHGYETIFPIPLGEVAAFDPELWQQTASAAAVEAAAEGIALTFAPMLDVGRDPRWGRIAESPARSFCRRSLRRGESARVSAGRSIPRGGTCRDGEAFRGLWRGNRGPGLCVRRHRASHARRGAFPALRRRRTCGGGGDHLEPSSTSPASR